MSRPASYSQNDNQNYFSDGNHTSSKVLRPPGGGSSISLGWDDGNSNTHNDSGRFPPRQQQQQQQNCNPITGASYEARDVPTNSSTYSMKAAKKNQEITGKIGGGAPLAQFNRDPYQQPPANQYQQSQQAARHSTNPNGAYDATAPTQYRAEERQQDTYSQAYQQQQQAPAQSFAPRDQYQPAREQHEQPREQQRRAPQQEHGQNPNGAADHNHGHLGIRDSSNKFANGANQNCGNMITDRSSTRIHAPPGGHSSIHFG